MSRADRSDPAVRAEEALRRFARSQTLTRRLRVVVLGLAALMLPFAVDDVVGTPGSVLGAVVLSGLCVGLAVAVAPWAWSSEEHDQHRLEAIWSETRADAAERVPWERHAAWALAGDDHVVLLELTCAPCTDTTPRRLRQRHAKRFDAEAIADAAGAMAALRQELDERELAARQAHLDGRLRAEQHADDAALAAMESAAARAQHESEAHMRREVAAENAAERRAQAAALAEALRRP